MSGTKRNGGPGRGQGNRKDDVANIRLSGQAREQLNALVAQRRAQAGTKLSHKDVIEQIIAAAVSAEHTTASNTGEPPARRAL